MNWKDISLMPQNIPLETIDSGGNTYLHNSNNYLRIC